MNCNSIVDSWKTCLLLVIVLFCGCNSASTRKVPFIIARVPSDIQPVNDLSNVPMVLYDVQIDLDQLPTAEKKDMFIRMMLPSVLAVYDGYDKNYRRVDQVLTTYHFTGNISVADSLWLDQLSDEMYAKDYWDLRRRIKPNPVSIILAQAAIESGWGTSRMFLDANNVFGVWSFDPDERRIKTDATRNGKPVYLRSYSSLHESVADYMRLFATVAAYDKFRAKKLNQTDPTILSRSLTAYSEQGIQYASKVVQMIRQNNLQRYDSARLDARFSTTSVFRF